MKRASTKQTPADLFEEVRTVGLALPGVEATTQYDGSPVAATLANALRGSSE